MEKDEVDRKVLASNLHRILGACKAEVTAQFQQKIFHPVDQAAVQIGFAMPLRQAEKFE